MAKKSNSGCRIAALIVSGIVLVFGLYFPRHRRRDMVVAFLGVNIGVLAVSEALLASTVSAGGASSPTTSRHGTPSPRRFESTQRSSRSSTRVSRVWSIAQSKTPEEVTLWDCSDPAG